MNTAQIKAVSKMSDTMIFCELRSVWNEVESNMRAGIQPAKRLGDYAALLTREQAKRAA